MALMEQSLAISSSQYKKKKQKNLIKTKVILKLADDDEQPPFVTHFPSGYVPPAKLAENDGLSLHAYQSARQAKTGRNLLVMKTGNVDFVGTSVTADAQMRNPCQYLLGMRNKRTGELYLTPVAANKILRMEPRVRGISYGQASLEEERDMGSENSEAKLEEMRKRRKSLTEAFGSKKSRRKMDTIAKGVVEEANIAAASSISQLVQSAAQKDGMLTVAEVEAKLKMAELRNIPPVNQDAKVPEDAYPIDRIIHRDDWRLLDLKAKELMSAKEMKGSLERIRKHYPGYVLSRLDRVGLKGDEEIKRRAQILVYLTHLLKFYCAPPSLSFKRKVQKRQSPISDVKLLGNGEDGEDGEELKELALVDPTKNTNEDETDFIYTPSDPTTVSRMLHMPQQLVEKFISLYSERGVELEGDNSSRWRREKKHTNLLICTICALALHVDGFRLNPEVLAKDLKLTPVTLVPYFRELGCKVKKVARSKSNEGGSFDVSLEIPLTFVQNSRGRKK